MTWFRIRFENVCCFDRYPEVERGKRYLNSGLFMGYAPELWQILNSGEITNDADDQRFYTKVYLDTEKRQQLQIKLDHRSDLFQNLNGAESDIELRFSGMNSLYSSITFFFFPKLLYNDQISPVNIDGYSLTADIQLHFLAIPLSISVFDDFDQLIMSCDEC